MFGKILVANRGEIACRVMRTARRMGVRTVAVYSEADAGTLHVAMADEAVAIGPAPAAESYLDAEKIVAAAKATGAEAIHPGYGFLSENPDFVDRVLDAGITFIGPSAGSIRAMGLKDAAKRLMEEAGVPVVPGYHGDGQGLVLLAGKARESGYPVLIKARAGGGGKGMRRVERPEDFSDALAGARREAKAAFGDDRVLIEKYVGTARHIEVQVFGDTFGNVVHLFERDCSAQRRHQKVIEEAPAPGMPDELRSAMTEAAVKAARAVNYVGAGTVEFIVDASGPLSPERFWFMEMNTRLQVEHPVTEMVTGLDLVEWQLRVAAGERLPLLQEDIGLSGHAFEARLYAEDPQRDFLPAAGRLHHLRFADAAPGAALRVETGVRQGDTISTWYDPMIAKLVVHAGDRETARQALVTALEGTEVAGTVTNLAFLAALARDGDFAAGTVDTDMIARRQAALTAAPTVDEETMRVAAAAALGLDAPRDPHDPWSALAGYAHFHPLSRRVRLTAGDATVEARVTVDRRGAAQVALGDSALAPLSLEGVRLARWPGHVTVFGGAVGHDIAIADPLEDALESGPSEGSLRAPMPGLVKIVRAAAGAAVTRGQSLLVLEAMKMEHTIAAPRDGTLAEIATEGSQVTEGTVLVRFAEG